MDKLEHGGDIYGNPGVTLDFSVNTNPLGMPREIRQALFLHVNEFSRYPDPQCRELRTAIATYENVAEDWILCGNGAADLIYKLCYAIRPRRALVCAPTFSEYENALVQVGSQIIHYVLKEENQLEILDDILEIITPDIDMIFLCNPNNPTSRLIAKEMLNRILNMTVEYRITVVIDECFLNFTDCGISCKKYLQGNPKLVVLKAFTKMYAMAGLRLGYLMNGDMELLRKINAAGQYWSVSVPAQIAGIAALTSIGWEEKTRALIKTERKFLSENLLELPIKVFPSDANFILLNCTWLLYDLLLKRGILIRSCENFIGLKNLNGMDSHYYRIAIKTRDENARLIQALKEIF